MESGRSASVPNKIVLSVFYDHVDSVHKKNPEGTYNSAFYRGKFRVLSTNYLDAYTSEEDPVVYKFYDSIRKQSYSYSVLYSPDPNSPIGRKILDSITEVTLKNEKK